MTTDEIVLALDAVTKRFSSGATTVGALEGVTASVRRGERVALLGANGAGKTTCMDLVCGVTQPTSGRITALGGSPRRAVQRGRMTAVLQTGGLLRDLTVLETVQIIAGLHGRPERSEAVLGEAGLSALAKRLVGRCSGGEQQRLKYALALIPDPEVMVLDEPAAGLDIEGRATLWDHVGQRAQEGTTILHSTHHLEEVEAMADRVLLLQEGRLVADHRIEDLVGRRAPRTVSARLASGAVLHEALRALTAITGVRDDGTSHPHIHLVASPEVSDAVAARLLGEFRGTELSVGQRPLRTALADLMAGSH